MPLLPQSCRWVLLSLLWLVGLLGLSAVQAAAPKLIFFYPAGAQQGQSVKVAAAGEFSTWPVETWIDQPGLTVTPEADIGKFSIHVAADAQPGVRWLRMHTAEGASSLRPFLIDQLPEVAEVDPNNKPEQGQAINLPAIVNGKLEKNGDVDVFALKLEQGQTLVASLQGNRVLGSPMDSVLQICQRVETKRSIRLDGPPQVEAHVLVQNHDARGLDPQIIFTAPQAGTYLLRTFAFPSVPGSGIHYEGGDTFVYRLSLTTGPMLDHTLPLAVQRNVPMALSTFGWNIPADKSTHPFQFAWSAAPAQVEQIEISLPQVAGTAEVLGVAEVCSVAGDAAKTAVGELVTIPQSVSGRLAQSGEMHTFKFTGSKGSRVKLALASRELGFPLDAVLTVSDAAGSQLAQQDDAGAMADPELIFVPPADGEYLVSVRDLHDRGGLRFAYRLTLAIAQPDFLLTLPADAWVVAAGKPLEIVVAVDRKEGFSEAIEIVTLDLPAGVTAEKARSEGTGDSAKSVKLVFQTAADAQPARGVIRITGTALGDSKLTRTAKFSPNLPFTSPQSAAWLTVIKP